ncbi:MAG: AAA family ATPase [Syntrophorhabdus sp.]
MVISIANQKGGVGKTTTAVNLSASIAVSEHKTLVIDMDSQCNTTSGYGIPYISNAAEHIYQVLIGEKKIGDVIRKTAVPYLDIIPSHPDLVAAEIELLDLPEREYALKKAIDELGDTYQYIFIDCPPSLGLLTINSLAASNCVIIPLQCEYFALEGLAMLLRTINVIQRKLNPDLEVLGILLTMFDRRNNLSFRVWEEVTKCFDDTVFKTVIPRNVKLSESPSHGKPALLYDISSSGAESYLRLASEILEKRSQA